MTTDYQGRQDGMAQPPDAEWIAPGRYERTCPLCEWTGQAEWRRVNHMYIRHGITFGQGINRAERSE